MLVMRAQVRQLSEVGLQILDYSALSIMVTHLSIGLDQEIST